MTRHHEDPPSFNICSKRDHRPLAVPMVLKTLLVRQREVRKDSLLESILVRRLRQPTIHVLCLSKQKTVKGLRQRRLVLSKRLLVPPARNIRTNGVQRLKLVETRSHITERSRDHDEHSLGVLSKHKVALLRPGA